MYGFEGEKILAYFIWHLFITFVFNLDERVA